MGSCDSVNPRNGDKCAKPKGHKGAHFASASSETPQTLPEFLEHVRESKPTTIVVVAFREDKTVTVYGHEASLEDLYAASQMIGETIRSVIVRETKIQPQSGGAS